MSQMQMLEKYNCEKCRFSTRDVNKYNIHIALHNEMKYVCSHCNFESYTKSEFQRHLVSHTGKFPYTCEYCGYGAIRNDYIVKHIKRIHGDGKIQCSVSTVENDSKNASVNIMQTQMRNSLQEILPNNTTVIAKNVRDLTHEVDNSIFNNRCHLNGNGSTHADQVEVEVISPTDQQLYPWMPLTVIAPTWFRVPDNCIAQVVEVKPVNSTCYLVLKCLEVVDSNGTKNATRDKNMNEQNTSEPMVTSENCIGPSDGTSLIISDIKSLLPTKNTAAPTEENTNSVTSPLNDNEIIDALHGAPNELFDEAEEVSDGPIISSVFSLSSGSHNVIEGIQWECPIVTNTNASNHIVDTTPSLNGIKSQGGPQVLENAAKSLVEIEMVCGQKAVAENELPDTNTMDMKNTGPEIQLPLNKPVLPYGKRPENQTSALAQSNKTGERKSNRLTKIETNLFSKPQTLFLSCDKRIVMQPLSCVMQAGHKADASRESELVPLKVKKPSAKPKSKILSKRFSAPVLKTLRLCPVKADQLTQMPHKNQPVVVLNHPEMESLEVSSIMKAISMFKGMVLKVTLSKQTRRKIT
ncbi:PREDICTED: zinc finger protein 518B [Nanorana parkeri]|uniref:zinc finger protein 518B n=1 Tax=Nanorana parkeri TaxID=125878 RepID=UPI000854F494|nr:PREDICTED: zinc finger protein 518B [Nanorana parkeri]